MAIRNRGDTLTAKDIYLRDVESAVEMYARTAPTHALADGQQGALGAAAGRTTVSLVLLPASLLTPTSSE